MPTEKDSTRWSSTVLAWDCASNYGVFKVVGSAVEPYRVSFYGAEGGAFCTCPAWKYKRGKFETKDCKHIAKIYEGACMQNPQWREGDAHPEYTPVAFTCHEFSDKKCPACGGSTVCVAGRREPSYIR